MPRSIYKTSIKDEWRKHRIVVVEFPVDGNKKARAVAQKVVGRNLYISVETIYGNVVPSDCWSFDNAVDAQKFINELDF